jgi:hypothetical protein
MEKKKRGIMQMSIIKIKKQSILDKYIQNNYVLVVKNTHKDILNKIPYYKYFTIVNEIQLYNIPYSSNILDGNMIMLR